MLISVETSLQKLRELQDTILSLFPLALKKPNPLVYPAIPHLQANWKKREISLLAVSVRLVA